MAPYSSDPEQTPLLAESAAQTPSEPNDHVSSAIKKRLYVSHLLSTWNSRVFEFGAVLYLATIFPNTLLPMSVYALARGISAIFLSPAVGRYIDTGNRLTVVRLSIVLQRLAVTASCVMFWFLATGWRMSRGLQWGIFAILAGLACIEKLASIMNLVSVEKDWVVIIAERNEPALREVNAQMRRIDLICKLAGPFFISIIDGVSTEIAILVNFGMNVASVVVEYYAIARVYKVIPALQQPKTSSNNGQQETEQTGRTSTWRRFNGSMWRYFHDLRAYFRHPAFLPSFAGALLYFTVLNFAGQMITYLIASGYNSVHIGVARSLSVIFEIASTWTAPIVMSAIGPIRSGIWFVNWQILCLAGAAGVFWFAPNPMVAASGLVVGTILSRIGLRGFDLSAQIIVQEEVEAEFRGTFSSLEASWQNFFEICSYASTIVFFRPEQFRWPALMSCMAVFLAGTLYTFFVRLRRGHLLHLSRCFNLQDRKKRLVEPALERLLTDHEASEPFP